MEQHNNEKRVDLKNINEEDDGDSGEEIVEMMEEVVH